MTLATETRAVSSEDMSIWQRWLKQPRQIWLRRVLFQVHLWLGVGIGLYIFMISLTGSAIVYRREMTKAFARPPVSVTAGPQRLSEDQLRAIAARLFPAYTVAEYFEAKKPNEPVAIVLRRGGKGMQRLFDPYTGADLGDSLSARMRTLEWLVDLHDNLLAGKKGRFVNGIGSVLTMALALTGIVIWWPGVRNWRRGLTIKFSANFPRLNYDLHSAMGFWLSVLIFIWGFTGAYLSFPGPFYAFFNRLDPDDNYTDTVLQQFEFLHFGRYGRYWQSVWVVFGLVPAALFVTGFIMWWIRKIRYGSRWPD